GRSHEPDEERLELQMHRGPFRGLGNERASLRHPGIWRQDRHRRRPAIHADAAQLDSFLFVRLSPAQPLSHEIGTGAARKTEPWPRVAGFARTLSAARDDGGGKHREGSGRGYGDDRFPRPQQYPPDKIAFEISLFSRDFESEAHHGSAF